MSARAHYSTDEVCRTTFAARVAANPAAAVHLVLTRGFSVIREDVPTPFLTQLEALPKDLRGEYALRHAAEISLERRALVLVAAQDNVLREHDRRTAETRVTARAAFVEDRARELEAQWNADRMSKWREIAEREAAVRFDGAPASEDPQPKRRRAPA